MAFFNKLAFWKKKDDLGDLGKDLDLGKDFDLGKDLSGPNMGPDMGLGLDSNPPDFGAHQQSPPLHSPPMGQPSYPPPQNFTPISPYPSSQPPYPDPSIITQKNLEVLASKMDALKAMLESINQRLVNIESIARGEQEESSRKRYY